MTDRANRVDSSWGVAINSEPLSDCMIERLTQTVVRTVFDEFARNLHQVYCIGGDPE
jgi:hypothetical protein